MKINVYEAIIAYFIIIFSGFCTAAVVGNVVKIGLLEGCDVGCPDGLIEGLDVG